LYEVVGKLVLAGGSGCVVLEEAGLPTLGPGGRPLDVSCIVICGCSELRGVCQILLIAVLKECQ
jgi:hypothetical protein